ncbi:MAG: EamA family transporter, partial [Spirochaetota bacterium]
ILGKERSLKSYVTVVIAFIGILLTLNVFSFYWSYNSLWGLGSGILAALAIIFLNLSRQYDDTDLILLFVFTTGSVFIFIFFFSSFYWPNQKELFYLAFCSINGILGQYFLTLGIRYISAIEGGIISTMRIFLAAFLGPLIAGDPPITLLGITGAVLIFFSNVSILLNKDR